MRLSTKGRYAVTAMLDLAINSGSGPVTLAESGMRLAIEDSTDGRRGVMHHARLPTANVRIADEGAMNCAPTAGGGRIG